MYKALSTLNGTDLSVGAKRSELPFVYEESKNFQPIPTFGVTPYFSNDVIYRHGEILPNFSAPNSLLGEVYLEIFQDKLPTSGRLLSTRRLIEVLDKGNAAIGITGHTTSDPSSGKDLFYNEVVFFMKVPVTLEAHASVSTVGHLHVYTACHPASPMQLTYSKLLKSRWHSTD